jgi:transcriptional regulator with XRE-family HTH domain
MKEKKDILNKVISEEERLRIFAKRLKSLRKEKGLSQPQLSKKLKFGVNAIHDFEAGRFPRADRLRKIKDYFKVSYEYLLVETDDPNPNPNQRAILNDNAINEIEKIISDLKNN